jgi:hypothetical protein
VEVFIFARVDSRDELTLADFEQSQGHLALAGPFASLGSEDAD